MRSIKVAIVAGPVVPVPPEKYGGTERVIYYLIKGLKELGHQPILVGPGDSHVDCPIIPTVDQALWLPRRRSDMAHHARRLKDGLQRTEKAIRSIQNEVDILHSHGVDMLPFRSVPTVTTLHGPISFEQFPHLLRRLSLPYVCISNNQTKVLPALTIAGVVYNGLDPEEFEYTEKPEDYVTFIGRFDREKNPHLALKLARSLGVKIKVAGKLDHLGDGYFDEEVKPFFNDPQVEFLGEIGLDQKAHLLANAVCNFHPTGFREPFGLTVLEAAYCGTPTLAIARGSMPELIVDGKTGVLVEDFEEGYSAFDSAKMLHRETIAAYARSTFTYKNMAADYAVIYEKVMAQHKKPFSARRLISSLLSR